MSSSSQLVKFSQHWEVILKIRLNLKVIIQKPKSYDLTKSEIQVIDMEEMQALN